MVTCAKIVKNCHFSSQKMDISPLKKWTYDKVGLSENNTYLVPMQMAMRLDLVAF